MMADGTFTIKDASGAIIYNQLMVEDLHILTFKELPPQVTANIIRHMPDLEIKDDDVMLCSFPKSGTHWCLEILSMLKRRISDFSPEIKTNLLEMFPEAVLQLVPSPRLLLTHLPVRWLPRQMKEKKTKVILLLRNSKDTVVSAYYHHIGADHFHYDGKFSDFLALFLENKLAYGSWFDYALDFEKASREEPDRFKLVYFEDLKEKGVEEIKKMAKFLDLDVDDNLCAEINEKCSFKSLVAHNSVPVGMRKEIKGSFSIFRKGEIGDWKNHFTVAESEIFDELFQKKMESSTLKFRFEPLTSLKSP